jgi:hypothetical protein
VNVESTRVSVAIDEPFELITTVPADEQLILRGWTNLRDRGGKKDLKINFDQGQRAGEAAPTRASLSPRYVGDSLDRLETDGSLIVHGTLHRGELGSLGVIGHIWLGWGPDPAMGAA